MQSLAVFNFSTLTRKLVALTLSIFFSAMANAAYPDRAIKIIVPYPPGGTTDLLIRSIAPRLAERLKQAVVIENRGGAGGLIGSQFVAKSAPDGYTLVFASIATHGILPILIKPVPYDPVKDFAPITLVATTPNVMLVNAAVPVKTMAEMLALARAKPGTVNFGSTSLGGSPHMSGELLKTLTHIDMVHIPYKGGSPMMIDLLGGQIPFAFDNLPSAMPHIKSGKIRALAVTTTTRWPGSPDIPTMAEAGVPSYEASAWFGLLAPGGTPPAVVNLLQKNMTAILRMPEVEKIYLEQGALPVGGTPEEFSSFISSELIKWSKVVVQTGVKLD
jgi:tripartite-type tricarboxylate transporter receptor subunit TctC